MFRYMDQVYAVYQEGSFTKAAKRLCVSQPALSATVKKAEDALGYPIFDRSTKAITLTDIGKQYIEAAEQILLIRENLQHRIDDTQNLRRGSFILGGTTFIISDVLPDTFRAFGKRYPDIDIDIQVEPSTVLWEKLRQGQVDIAIDNALTKDPDHAYIPLFQERILVGVPEDNPINDRLRDYRLDPAVLRVGCDYEKMPKVDMSVFASEDFILLKPGNKMRQIANNIFTEAGISPRICYEFDLLSTSISFADAGFGVCFLTDTVLNYSGPCKNLVLYQPNTQYAERNLYLMYKKNKYLSSATRAFIDCLTESF